MDTELSYDKLPYPSKFFVAMHPDRLATQATLFGMNPSPVKTCRVFELGCGNGSHLASLAYLFPEAEFVGIDISKRHIDDARAAVAELGLANCEFRQMDLMDVSRSEFGPFDYVTAHGLISWVPDFVCEKVLTLCRELLTENGVGYLSYMVYPAAHQREMVQKAMKFHTRGVSDPDDKTVKAVEFLKFLAENTTDRGMYQAMLKHELKRHATHEASDIFHDDLSDINRAFYFQELAGMLDNAGLQYLGEAELHAMGAYNLPSEARAFVDSLDNGIEREQYLDIVRGRIFRQTLFCHKEIELERETTPAIIDRFMIASSLRPLRKNPDLASAKIEKFVGANKAGIEIDQPLTKAILADLGGAGSRAVPFPELVKNGKRTLDAVGYKTSDWKQQEDNARSILLQIARASSMVTLHVCQLDASTEVSDKPAISSLARWQMKTSKHVLTLLGMDMKIDDAVSRRLLELLDGTRNRAAVLTDMKEFINTASGIEGRKELIRTLPGWLDESLSSLAKIGLFAA